MANNIFYTYKFNMRFKNKLYRKNNKIKYSIR